MNDIRSTFGASALAVLALLTARPDDPRHADPKQGQPIPIPLPGATGATGGEEDPHAEMRRLFGKIERDMREIDRLLADASSAPGATASAQAREKTKNALEGIQKLLDSSEERGKSVLAGIDRILELARHQPTDSSSCESAGGMCENGSSGSSGKSSSNGSKGSKPGQDQDGQQAGKSPLDRQGENSTQREATPKGPEAGSEKSAEKGGGKGERDPQTGEPKKDAGQPKGNEASRALARNNPANPPPGSAADVARAGANSADKWGDLPVHVRDVFRAQGGGDMPAQYRDWIDAYYRRMAKRSGS